MLTHWKHKLFPPAHLGFKSKVATFGGELVNFNKRYQNTKKIGIYVGIMATFGNFNDLLRFWKFNSVIFYHNNFSMIVCKLRKMKCSSLCESKTNFWFAVSTVYQCYHVNLNSAKVQAVWGWVTLFFNISNSYQFAVQLATDVSPLERNEEIHLWLSYTNFNF